MKKEKSFLSDLLEVAISVIVITFILLKFVIYPCQVNGSSMVPTLNDKDFAYSFIITKTLGIKRFDIAVIETSLEGKERKLVKRVIGLPGETVEYKNNQLFINGEKVNEEYLKDTITEDFIVKLGDDEYYCLGDNRSVSRDSRFYGPFNKDNIVSTNILVIYPFNAFGVKK